MGTTAAVSIASRVVPDGVVVTFRNDEDRGVVFHTRTRSRLGRSTAHAHMFTVDPGSQRLHTFLGSSAEGYHVEIQGPRALHQELSGLPTPGPEVVPHVSRGRRGLLLALTNDGPSVDLTVRDAYAAGTELIRLHPGAEAIHTIDNLGGCSYDLTVTSNRDPRFIRRFVGSL